MRLIPPHILLIITVISLSLPNIVLSVTEPMSWMARLCNIILPVSAYLLLMTLLRNTGKMVWAMFIFIFLAAFQLVLLYLFGESILPLAVHSTRVTALPTDSSSDSVNGGRQVWLSGLYLSQDAIPQKNTGLPMIYTLSMSATISDWQSNAHAALHDMPTHQPDSSMMHVPHTPTAVAKCTYS